MAKGSRGPPAGPPLSRHGFPTAGGVLPRASAAISETAAGSWLSGIENGGETSEGSSPPETQALQCTTRLEEFSFSQSSAFLIRCAWLPLRALCRGRIRRSPTNSPEMFFCSNGVTIGMSVGSSSDSTNRTKALSYAVPPLCRESKRSSCRKTSSTFLNEAIPSLLCRTGQGTGPPTPVVRLARSISRPT